MSPKTLDELRQMEPGPARIHAVADYIAACQDNVTAARKIRDDDLRALAAEHGPAKAARLANVSLSTVKLAVGRP